MELQYFQKEDDDVRVKYPHVLGKPVIYLYPEQKTSVRVELEVDGDFLFTYPEYNDSLNGWSVQAYPDGRIINNEDNREYSYLFWEAESYEDFSYDRNKGFMVETSKITSFLEEKLKESGLTPKEYNEFIVYWAPMIQNTQKKYVHVYFSGQEYTDKAKLNISPKPDSIKRVFLIFEPTDTYSYKIPQNIESFSRDGFTVLEWGGTIIDE